MSMWQFLEAILMMTNALAILNEDRFLVPHGWGFSEMSGGRVSPLKVQIIGLLHAVQYLRDDFHKKISLQEIQHWTHVMKLPQLHGLGPAAARLLDSYTAILLQYQDIAGFASVERGVVKLYGSVVVRSCAT